MPPYPATKQVAASGETPDLPFIRGELDPAFLDSLLRRTSAEWTLEDTTVGQTALLPEESIVGPPPRGNFTDDLGALVVPDLDLEQYVALRVELILRGEEDTATLRSFGVRTMAAHAALRARFAEIFQTDSALRDRFVAEVRRRVELRRSLTQNE